MTTVIERLKQWPTDVEANEVSVDLARQIRSGQVSVERPVQMVARIQIILVEAGMMTDDQFVNRLKA